MDLSIRDHPFFALFSDHTRARLVDASTVTARSPGEVLFAEGDAPDDIYLVLSGSVGLYKESRPGERERLAKVPAGEYFGEMGVIDGLPRSATAVVESPSTIARVPGALVMEALEHEPSSVCLQFVHRISQYLRTTNLRFIEQVVHKARMQLVGEMASSTIHDFKNPMTGIQLAVEMIGQRTDDPVIVRYCELIRGQLRRMLAMAEELLAYSRGVSQLQKERVVLGQLLHELLVYNEDYAKRQNVSLEVLAADLTVEVDRVRLLRALQNLINNSIEAMSSGGVVVVRGFREGDVLRIDVSDNGPGIPESIRDKLFEPFVTHGKKGGTGLGMAIARAVVEAHGGSIGFTTETGKGTTFTVRLPCLAS